MGIGIKSTFRDLGLEAEVQVNTDSSAARSLSSRRGAGRVRHVEVRELWAQDKVNSKELSIVKVGGEDSVTDFAKHVDRFKFDLHMKFCGFTFREGRPELCPHLGDV